VKSAEKIWNLFFEQNARLCILGRKTKQKSAFEENEEEAQACRASACIFRTEDKRTHGW